MHSSNDTYEREKNLANNRLGIINKIKYLKNQIKYIKYNLESNLASLDLLEKELREFDQDYLQDRRITQFTISEDLWKIGVDAQDHPYGRLSYDEGTNTYKCSEPGYIDAMETATAFMFRTVGQPLTPDYIKTLHRICCTDVKPRTGRISGGHYMSGRMPLTIEMTTKEGLHEMAEWDFIKCWVFKNYDGDRLELTSENCDQFFDLLKNGYKGESKDDTKNCDSIISNFIEEYKYAITRASNDDNKLLAIATLAKKIDYLHPFQDGNIRTIRLLIQKCLIENKFGLTYMQNPNIIDGHSSLQIVDAIKVGFSVRPVDQFSLERPRPMMQDLFPNAKTKNPPPDDQHSSQYNPSASYGS
jgi:hypothetical protein